MTYFTREQWGARPPLTGGNPPTNGPQGVAIHYNGGAMYLPASCRCDIAVRNIQNYHMDSNGWKDVAYDVLCCPHGNTYQGRIDTINGTGANGTKAANASHMAVMALIGEGETPTPALYAAVKEGIKLCQARGAGSEITGHNTFAKTACPGQALLAWIKEGMPTDLITEDIIMAEVLTIGLKNGSKGTEVALLQKMLNGLIQANLTTDGSFGPATEAKVKDFQKYNGLTADGSVGPATRTILNRDWATYVAAITPDPTPAPAPTPTPTPSPVPDPVVDVPTTPEIDLDALADAVVAKIIQRLSA